MLLILIFLLLVASQLVVGLLVFLQSQHNKRIEQRIFAVVTFVITLWTIANGLLISVDTAGNASNMMYYDVVNRVAFSLAGLLLTGIYLFSLFYPARSKLGVVQKGLLGAGLFLTILGPTSWVAGSFVVEGGDLVYRYGAVSSAITVLAIIAVISMYVRQSQILRHTHDLKLRRQAKTLLIGMTLTIVHAVIFIILLPALLGQQQAFFAVGYAAPLYLVVTTGYGMLRQGLFDIRGIVVRSLAYLLSLGVVSLVYAIPAVLLTTYISDAPISLGALALLVGMTLVVAFLFQPLRNYFNKVTRKLFYRDYYEPQDVLDKMGALLVGTVDITEIETRSRAILEEAFKPTFLHFLLLSDRSAEPEDRKLVQMLVEGGRNEYMPSQLERRGEASIVKQLQLKEIALAVRLRTRHEDLGFMLFGYRRSGALYATADLRLLGVVADELAIGLQNALRFEEIRKFNTTLQQKIEEATRKLRKTNERLRVLDQTKDDFISMASHQLRTPLTSVKGYVSMVLDGDGGKINDTQRKLLTQSFLSAQRMVYLISDLLNVSRLKTDKFVIEPVESNLADVIDEEVAQLTETVKSRGLELTYHKPEHFPTLMLDETKIRQVLMNFIDNAIYYTPTGGHIDVYLVDKPDSIEFTVVDDGIGVPKHEQHHLFSKFYRAKNAKNARPDGTGLGIFMAKKVVIAQGGAIIFKSTEGKGSTFGFTFPKAALLPAKEAKATPAR